GGEERVPVGSPVYLVDKRRVGRAAEGRRDDRGQVGGGEGTQFDGDEIGGFGAPGEHLLRRPGRGRQARPRSGRPARRGPRGPPQYDREQRQRVVGELVQVVDENRDRAGGRERGQQPGDRRAGSAERRARVGRYRRIVRKIERRDRFAAKALGEAVVGGQVAQ